MNIGFERIYPTPTYPVGVTAAGLYGKPWKSGGDVELFKKNLRIALLDIQSHRCCFCRRGLNEPSAIHLEHFVDHTKFEAYRFEIRNLALSCGICNIKKAGYFRTWSARYVRLTKGPADTRTPVLKIPIVAGVPYPTAAKDFRWVNPHVHNYSAHIELARGWVFTGISPEGRRTVRNLRMNLLAEVERRAMETRLGMRGGMLSTLVGALAELDLHRASDVANVVAKVIQRRRKAKG